jgi:oxygen-dependent protoporphyrinogen oxidase
MSPTVAVVGGGITGLTGALALTDGGATVVLLEADNLLGGKIRTESFAGQVVETGPDAFLARVPHAVQLCQRLGLADELISPTTGAASVWVRGHLRRLPSGLVLGVPTRWGPLARSGILSPRGLARAALDLVLPTSRAPEDRSVAEVVSRRLGSQVADRLVGPLVGGINAGLAGSLSAKAAAPALDAAARAHRSLVLGLRQDRGVGGPGPLPATTTNTTAPQPVFLTHPAGLSTLVNALAAAATDAQVELRTGTPVTALQRRSTGWVLVTPSGTLRADGVLLTVPAFVAGPLLAPHAPRAAAILAAINYADVALVTLAYHGEANLAGSGYLVPAGEGRMTTACTFTSIKWAQVARRDQAIFRISVGRWGDSRHRDLSDAELVDVVRAELAEALGVTGQPFATRVSRWPRSFPQYEVGHTERVARIEAELPAGVAVAGAAYRGVGIPACIAGAQWAAAALLSDLRSAGE